MGRERVRAHVRRVPAARRPHGRPARPPQLFMAGLALFTLASLACGFAIVEQLPDRRARGAGPRRRDDRARRALDPHDDVRRGRGAQQGARPSGAPSPAPAARSACCSAACSRSTSAGSGSSSSTRRSASRRSCSRRGCSTRAASRTPSARSTSSARSSSRRASRCSSTPSSRPTSTTGSRAARSASSRSRSCSWSAFLFNEQRAAHPLLPLSIFRLGDDRRRERRGLHRRRGDLLDVLPARALHAAAARASTTRRSAAASATS